VSFAWWPSTRASKLPVRHLMFVALSVSPCCLLQQQPDGKYRPVCYFTNGLLPARENYTVTEIEGLGVV